MRALLCALALLLVLAPAAHAWPRPPRDLPLAGACVPGGAVSPELRAGMRVVGWRCVPKLRYRISNLAQVRPAASFGLVWCTLVNARPGPPLRSTMSLREAAFWCLGRRRFWRYVHYR